MGELNVYFWGICTIMQGGIFDSPDGPIEWGSRVVLVNGSNPSTINDNIGLAHHGIVPHFAQLQLLSGNILSMSDTLMPGFTVAPRIPLPPDHSPWPTPPVAWDLDNVLLSIANAERFPEQVIPGFTIGPGFLHLKDFVVGHVMPPPSVSMTQQTIPTRAACYFDCFSGHLGPHQIAPERAVIGRLAVRTFGNPVIRVRSFTSGNDIVNIELAPESNVVVANGPRDLADDKDEDFRLQYLTASSFPTLIGVPGATVTNLPRAHTDNPPWWDTALMSTFGCSNSIYP